MNKTRFFKIISKNPNKKMQHKYNNFKTIRLLSNIRMSKKNKAVFFKVMSSKITNWKIKNKYYNFKTINLLSKIQM